MQNNRLLILEQKVGSGNERFSVAKTGTFPSPATIYSNYPPKYQPDGSLSDYSWASNECAVRMSIALQKSGITATNLKKSDRFRKTYKHAGTGLIHQPSAAAMADWLHGALKYPKKMVHPTGQWQESDFAGKDGIIYFAHEHRGGDGPGHIDVLKDGVTGSGFYPNKVIWFWEYSGGSWSNRSGSKSVGMSNLSRQMNPGLFGIAGLEAVEAITLGLTATQTLNVAMQQNGKLSYQPVKASRLMKSEPRPYSNQPHVHNVFSASMTRGGGFETAKVLFEVIVDWNDFGEMVAYVKHNLAGSTSFDYSSMNVTFTNLGMYPRQGGEKDPRAWPIRFAYQGQFDPWGNGRFDFQGEFEVNAFGYFKVLKHDVVSRSFADWPLAGSPDDKVQKYPDKLSYTVPPLPPAQRKILLENYKNDPNYTGSR